MFEQSMWTFQEQIEAYKAKKKAIDAAPIKKVAEAKARKKRKVSSAFIGANFIMYNYRLRLVAAAVSTFVQSAIIYGVTPV